MIYLGQPYSHSDPNIRQERYRLGTLAALSLIQKGQAVFAPITHWHHAAIELGLPFAADFWIKYNKQMMDASRALYVLMLDGWDKSYGLYCEVKHAEMSGLPLYVYNPDEGIWKNVSAGAFLRKFTYGQDNTERNIVAGTDGTVIAG
jgi:hypothetical protein